jgi:hypothetical protein
MSKEVGRFLLETWQLFYWSFFCPSLLQQRMNEWSPNKTNEGTLKDTSAVDILLSNPRFVIQYLFISTSMSFPLAVLANSSGQGWDFLLLLPIPLITYVLGLCFLPSGISFCIPLMLALTYSQNAELFAKTFQFLPLIQVVSSVPRDVRIVGGTIVGVIALLLGNDGTAILMFVLAFVIAVCWSFSVAIYLAISSVSLSWFLLAAALLSFGCAPFRQKWLGIWIATAFIVLGWGNLTFNSLFAIPFSLIFYYRIFPDYLVAYLSSLVFQSLQKLLELNQSSFLTKLFIVVFEQSLENWYIFNKDKFSLVFQKSLNDWLEKNNGGDSQSNQNKGRNFPTTYNPYIQAIRRNFPPKYNPYAQDILRKWFELNQDSFFKKLPPYTTELLWLPLNSYQQILISTFHRSPELGLATFKIIQSISLPGSQLTIQGALPSIVADRFAAIRTTSELIDSITPSYPLLPALIPTFYQPDEITRFAETPKSGNSEIDIVFLLLQRLVKDIVAALQGGTSALRERGLERLVDQLKKLPTQLPGIGLKPQAIKRWQPAIECWQHILELEIAEQQKTSQGELLNPFQFGNPLRLDRAAIFKGRQDFADRLVRSILDRNRPTMVLHGPRRAGKTSFLLNLPRLLPSDLVPIYLDMQQASMTDSEGDFCYGLVRAIDRDTRSQGLQLPTIPIREDFYARPYPALQDWLDLALPQLGEHSLLLNLDEFEKIGSAIKDGRISERLFDQLRSMIQHYDRLGFLFSGVQTLEELGPRWSNYFISVVPMEMHYLEPHEAEDLLLHPDPEFTLRYDAGIVAEILRLTRCQPYLLQLIGSAIVNQANLQHTQLATTTLLQAAIQDAFTNGEPYFTNIWTEFTGNNDNPAEVTAGQQILIALAQGNTLVETSDETTAAARRRLLRYYVIERNGDIDKIEIPLFEQWVRERAIET